MKKKTERVYTPIRSLKHFYEKLTEFGDKTLYRYYLGRNDVAEMTFAEFSALTGSVAAGLIKNDLGGKRIAIVGETCPEWVSVYVAAVASGGVAIPMDKELKISEMCGFLEIAEADAIAVMPGMAKHIDEICESMPKTMRCITVRNDDETLDGKEDILKFEKIAEDGKLALEEGFEVPDYETTDRMAIMLFTSGTTGTSKCVMLSEKNAVAAVNSACEAVDFSADDTIVSVLPIHHTYELCCHIAAINYGVTVCINDSLKNVLRNFAFFKPTGIILVPLFVNTMYKKIWDTAKKSGKDKKLAAAITASKTMRKVGIDMREKLFKEVREAFGGRLNKIICGGAALNPDYVEKFEEFGINIYEGYGITECSPLISVTPYYAPKRGSVGPCVQSCTAKIDGTAKNDKGFIEGEICVKGENVMLGYYKNEKATEEAFDEEGYYRTGDIGYMDGDGYIYITGRKKSVIVLNNGKNVFPEEIEEYLGNIDSIAESVVVGRKKADSDEVVLTAIVFPAFDKFEKDTSLEDISEKIKADINEMNKKLPSFKQVRNIELRKTEFEKTTSRKIKRYLVK